MTSQPGVFPKHPPFEGLLRPSFVSPRRTDGPPNIWDTSGISGNVDIDALFLAALWLSHWARGCGLVEQPTASSRFGSTGVLWVLTGTHRCDTPIQAG